MKQAIIIIMVLTTIYTANAIMCEDVIEPYVNCTMVTPIIDCDNHTYQVYNETGSIVTSGTLTQYDSDIYYFYFNEEDGEYLVKLCDNRTTREIIVEKDLTRYVIAIVIILVLLALGYTLKQHLFLIMAGMLFCILALYIYNTGFPDVTNRFLINSIVIVIAGMGFYYLIAPSVDYWQNK